ncbi:MAG: hypothetical protein IT173_02605 [Acidobacteria bacterium]|nr:hypothetical protein [Acidobacteriota bacterium]
MGISISNKVGPIGQYPNLPGDVKTIANGLNRISVADGGVKGAPPDKQLDESTGIMSEKLLTAIQTFQLKQFGWPGADRRVFPGGETIGRMNQLLTDTGQPGTGETFELPKSNLFFFSFARRGPDMLSKLLISVKDPMNDLQAFFVVGRGFFGPQPFFTRDVRILWPGKAISIVEFRDADFVYSTSLTSSLVVGPNGPERNGFTLDNSIEIKLRGDRRGRSFSLPSPEHGEFAISEATIYAIRNPKGEERSFTIEGTMLQVTMEEE